MVRETGSSNFAVRRGTAPPRRELPKLWTFAFGLLAFAPWVHAQQPYPVKPVRIIVPVAPGGGTDPQARLLARKFQESMGQTFVVENRPGAASMIGTEAV